MKQHSASNVEHYAHYTEFPYAYTMSIMKEIILSKFEKFGKKIGLV